jgi:hypothetical protein
MQTLRFGPEEGTWIKSVFGTIQLLGLAGAVFAVVDIWIWIICILVLLLIPTKTRKIISHMYFSIFTEDSKEIAALRDGEGSLKKIWYKGIDKQNEDVKSTRIFWIKPIRYFIPLYQIVVEMIDDRTNAIIEIENDSLKSKLQTLGEFDLANQVDNTNVLMQAQGANKQNLLNELINDCFKNLLKEIKNYIRNTEYNPPFYFNLDNGGVKDVNNIPELLKLCIDNPRNFMQYIRQQDFKNWLDNIEIGETELANIAQGTREKNFPNDDERLHYFLRECCLVLIGRNP